MASSMLAPATPQRPLPGAFLTTPAPAPSIFAQNTQALRTQQTSQPSDSSRTAAAEPELSPIERAARTINDTLAQEARFPALEDYIQNGVSDSYELPRNAAWQPFQVLKQYDLPVKILEQVNNSSFNVSMGLFASLGHAWTAIDNCLYLWDYTTPNPTIIGFEENKNTIEAVKLVKPKPGVFVKDIAHIIVVATSTEMLLLGVAPTTAPTGAKTLALYTTRMSIAIKGLGVRHIAGTSSGRIFFTGSHNDYVYEFDYRADEGWFQGRSARLDHGSYRFSLTGKAIAQYLTSDTGASIIQLLVDDSRGFVYTLDEKGGIKIWLIKNKLEPLERYAFFSLLSSSGHFTARTELLTGKNVRVESISAIPATEAARIALMAVTNTGCRVYLTLTRGFANVVNVQYPPSQMTSLHVRLPPTDPTAVAQLRRAPGQPQPSSQPGAPPNEPASQYLSGTRNAWRLPPGYTILILSDLERRDRERAFLLAEDIPHLKNTQDNSALTTRFVEYGQWLQLPSPFIDLQVITPDFCAASGPVGFGNELAVQFDNASLEMCIMTSGGIQIVRRRRLVDTFASIMRYGNADEDGIDGDVKKMIRAYGRGEIAATALAVACGQGVEVTSDARVASVTDPDVLERARTTFIDHGGKAELNANSVMETSNPVDNVKPSPRHEGLALYISRHVRSVWKAKLILQQQLPGQLPFTASSVPVTKLKSTQQALTDLQRFLEKNTSFIEGLSGPQALARLGTRENEIALQGEHRAMNSLLHLIRNIIEGISFALVLFDERLDDILALLSPEVKQQVLDLTYEGLIVSSAGKSLAKELVKAIVNRNIAKGANVDTVAEALRRRCGSFCSADDVVTFKAQEQVKRSREVGPQTETGRALLNESQRYFQKVATDLSMEHLQWAVQQYTETQFWAGAIQLCLAVAAARDRANRAVAWLRGQKLENDPRKAAYDERKRCYDLVFAIIQSMDGAVKQNGQPGDNANALASRRRDEAYNVINDSEDAVFSNCLYDWYMENGQANKLFETSNPLVEEYLQRRSVVERAAADLLWQYYAHGGQYTDSAQMQLNIAQGHFDLSLDERIAYLGRAQGHASTRQASIVESRQSRQKLLRTISDLLEVAQIQDEILQRFKTDARFAQPERREEVVRRLNSSILDVAELFNNYADQAGYHDISLQIYRVADHTFRPDIEGSWTALIKKTDQEAQALYGKEQAPWEAVAVQVRDLGRKLHISDVTFPVPFLFRSLETYAIEPRSDKPPANWAVDIFLDLDISPETLLPIAEEMFYSNEAPFTGTKRRILASHMVYLASRWKTDSLRQGERYVFGSEDNARMIVELLDSLLRGESLVSADRQLAESLQAEVRRLLR